MLQSLRNLVHVQRQAFSSARVSSPRRHRASGHITGSRGLGLGFRVQGTPRVYPPRSLAPRVLVVLLRGVARAVSSAERSVFPLARKKNLKASVNNYGLVAKSAHDDDE